jgi:hypothetical protein
MDTRNCQAYIILFVKEQAPIDTSMKHAPWHSKRCEGAGLVDVFHGVCTKSY